MLSATERTRLSVRSFYPPPVCPLARLWFWSTHKILRVVVSSKTGQNLSVWQSVGRHLSRYFLSKTHISSRPKRRLCPIKSLLIRQFLMTLFHQIFCPYILAYMCPKPQTCHVAKGSDHVLSNVFFSKFRGILLCYKFGVPELKKGTVNIIGLFCYTIQMSISNT